MCRSQIKSWMALCSPRLPIVYLGEVSWMHCRLYTPQPDPVCPCGGRHQLHECSIHAPTQPPEHVAPDHSQFASHDGGHKWWPESPDGTRVFRGRAALPPMASFPWRRFCHNLLWNYSNTEPGQMTDVAPLRPRCGTDEGTAEKK